MGRGRHREELVSGPTSAAKPPSEKSSFYDLNPKAAEQAVSGSVKVRGVGGHIRGKDGDLWGLVVADGGRTWTLASGRSAKKENQGKVWNWCTAEEVITDTSNYNNASAHTESRNKHFADTNNYSHPSAETKSRNEQSARLVNRPVWQDCNACRGNGCRTCDFKGGALQSRGGEGGVGGAAGPRVSVLDSLAEKKRQEEETRQAKRDAARQRRQQDCNAANCEGDAMKLDPQDGRAYSLQQLISTYPGVYSEREVLEYWETECKPVGGTQAHGGTKSGPRHGHEARRWDPDDNRAYTYKELHRKYIRTFSDAEIEAYWNKDCQST